VIVIYGIIKQTEMVLCLIWMKNGEQVDEEDIQ
jgi:hypothetical protein